MRRIRLVRWAPLLIACSVAGCVVLPVPVIESSALDNDSRGNIEEGAPKEIKIGASTRVEVLLALGAPDDRGDEDSWFRYRSVGPRGGMHVALVEVPIVVPPYMSGAQTVGNWDSAKWIVIRFDKSGVVSSVESGERQACQNQAVGAQYFANPCFDDVVPKR